MPSRSHAALLALILVAALLPACGVAPRPAGPGEPAKVTKPAKPLEIVKLATGPDGTLVAELSNGLTAIVRATPSAPVVCVRAHVKAGGLYEGQWHGSGISHLLEHLVAKGAVHGDGPGAAGKPPKQTRSRVSEIGGQSNAFTSMASTVYYIAASSAKTMDCVDLIADWMARPDITEEDFQREHGVVQRELEMGKDNPGRQMWYGHASDFFRKHPAALPIIGFARPLSELTLKDVRQYHARMYVPQNMVFSVVGDVDPDAVLKRICRAFGGFRKARPPRLNIGRVPEVSSTRQSVYGNKNLKDTMARISFRTVPLMHDDLYALDVLSYVLSAGRASRLVERIQRRKKLVTSIHSSSWTPSWGSGLFTIAFRAEPDKADLAHKAILAELKAAVEKPITAQELARAKRQKVADFVYSQQTVESQSSTLASDYLSTGDAWFSSDYTRRIQSVTAEQVQAAAKRYFDFDRMVVTTLVPRKRLKTASVAAEGAKTGGLESFKLPNGLRVALRPNPAVGLVSMCFVGKGGLLLETTDTNGLGTAMMALSTRGAGKRSAQEIARFFDGAGGSIAGKCGNNTLYWQSTVLADSFPTALEILADVVQKPTFSDDELAILRPVMLMSIKRIDEEWQTQLQKFWRGKFFTGSPYSMLSTGSADVVRKATTKQIAAYHRNSVKAGSSVLTIYGRFDAKAARKAVQRLFTTLPTGEVRLPAPPARTVKPPGQTHVLKTTNQVAAITVAVGGMKATNLEDRFAITVLDTIISGFRLPDGWLHQELRGKQLVYVVHAYNWPGLAPGAFVTYAACQPEKAPEVIAIIRKNLKRASNYKPKREEIDRAVNMILTAELLENQSMSDLAMSAALDELYGFGYDFRSRLESYYRKVTPEDVLRVGRKYLARPMVVAVTTPKPEAVKAPKKAKPPEKKQK